jgi:hypothetical protein
MKRLAAFVAVLCVLGLVRAADAPAKKNAKAGLQELNVLIGSWKGTGTPEGTQAEKQKGFWIETVDWEWQFKGDDAWLVMSITKGKHFTGGELRYLPAQNRYELKMQTVGKDTLVFTGPLEKQRLLLERTDEKTKETQRLVLSLLHDNRHLYHLESGSGERPFFKKLYQVGCTREGVSFAAGDNKPECVVSGGLGTMQVSYKGKTYYVCCTGCRDAFKDDPEKYIAEFEAKQKEKKR